MTAGPIDFAGLAAALLDRADKLVPQWLPGGKRVGHEYQCGDLTGGPGQSCSINLRTGRWADFATKDRGADLISLYAAIHGQNNGQAARELMRALGWERDTSPGSQGRQRPEEGTGAKPAPGKRETPDGDQRPEPPAQDEGTPGKRASMWRAIVPVPDSAPPPTFRHWQRGQPALTWEYRYDGKLYGYVARFETSGGGKEILPHTWCVDESDERGTRRWHWKQWDEPRPLYIPATILASEPALVPVVLVEGEKCALAGHRLLGHEFDFVTWPGGSKAWAKAAWSWLRGRVVYLWPDCDAKRARLSPQERQDGVDPLSKPVLPASRQPGMQAMVSIGSILAAELGCSVLLCRIPAPGAVSDGWDLADAIDQGWTAEQVRDFIRGALPFVPPDEAARAAAAGASTPTTAGADLDDTRRAWRSHLLTTTSSAIRPVRENLVLALDGMQTDGGWVQGVEDARDVIAFNEFTNEVLKLKDTPWGTPAGVWAEVDELLLGEWLTRRHHLPSMPRGTLEEAVQMVAYRHRFHPVRSYLAGLQWDGLPRHATWLARVCLEEDEWDERDPLHRYLALAGRFFLMGMCARVLQPGVKFDYMLILEGPQGMRKSTLFRVLAGEHFSDTGLVLGDKDSYQQLQGRWVYEFAELDSFGKAEVTKIKSFIASASDYFRASFDRRARDYPRQVVFGGTTNEDHYLTDPTGNRRFWPVRTTRLLDIDWLQANRDQLFAEAVHRLSAGERMYPTLEEEQELFRPQQERRQVENAIETAVARWLYDDVNGQICDEITLVELLGKVGIGIEKLGPGRYHEKQAAAALRRLGWTEGRSSRPGRPRVYRRPDDRPRGSTSSTAPTQGHQPAGAVDDCPF